MVLMIPIASSYSFGALTPDSSKKTTGNVSFKIGLINPGNQSLNVSFRSSGLENGEVVLPDSMILEPSLRGSVSKKDWISIGPNRYVKPRWIEFYVLTEDGSDNDFSVQAEARKPVISSSSTASPKIVQVREFKYSLDYQNERFSKEREQNESPSIFSFGSNETPEQNKSEKPKEYVKPEKTSETSENQDRSDFTTPVLAVVSLISVIYLWRLL